MGKKKKIEKVSKSIIGKCFICKKELSKHDISHIDENTGIPKAQYRVDWPGDGLLCTEHPGVLTEYTKLLEEANENNRATSKK